MTNYAETTPGEALVFLFETVPDSGSYNASCSINTDRSLSASSEITVSQRVDCDNPGAPTRPSRRYKSQDLAFSGAGVTDPDSYDLLWDLWEAGEPFNGKVVQYQADGVTPRRTITATWVIESLKTGGARGEDQTFDIAVAPASAWTTT